MGADVVEALLEVGDGEGVPHLSLRPPWAEATPSLPRGCPHRAGERGLSFSAMAFRAAAGAVRRRPTGVGLGLPQPSAKGLSSGRVLTGRPARPLAFRQRTGSARPES